MATVGTAIITAPSLKGGTKDALHKEQDDENENDDENDTKQPREEAPPTSSKNNLTSPSIPAYCRYLETIDENESLSYYEASDSDDSDDDGGSLSSMEGCFNFSSPYDSPIPSEPQSPPVVNVGSIGVSSSSKTGPNSPRKRTTREKNKDGVARFSFQHEKEKYKDDDDDSQDDEDHSTSSLLTLPSQSAPPSSISSSTTTLKETEPPSPILRHKHTASPVLMNEDGGVSTSTKWVHFESWEEKNSQQEHPQTTSQDQDNIQDNENEEEDLPQHHTSMEEDNDLFWYQQQADESDFSTTSTSNMGELSSVTAQQEESPLEMIEKAMAKYPLLCQYKFFDTLEKRFECSKVYFFIAFVTSCTVHLISMIGLKITTDFVATFIPARMTLYAVLQEEQQQQQRRGRRRNSHLSASSSSSRYHYQWMTYWLWFCGSLVLEHYLATNWTTPSYYLLKCCAVLWLCHPRFLGGQVIYHYILGPLCSYLNTMEYNSDGEHNNKKANIRHHQKGNHTNKTTKLL
mmetsp:Transcript_9538/g.13527  ORF Transcript_9538/g.13527 Transcript_9538/m.13527 type:complete len:516 (-) Transcript_9538:1028-2575(-)